MRCNKIICDLLIIPLLFTEFVIVLHLFGLRNFRRLGNSQQHTNIVVNNNNIKIQKLPIIPQIITGKPKIVFGAPASIGHIRAVSVTDC